MPLSDPRSLSARVTALEARLEAAEARLRMLETDQPPQSPDLAHRPRTPPTLPGTGWRPVYHKPPCGKVALYLTRAYARDETASLADMRVGPHLKPPEPGSPSVCASCGDPIDAFSSLHLDWSEALINTNQSATPTPTPTTTPADLTGRLQSITDAIARARQAGIPVP